MKEIHSIETSSEISQVKHENRDLCKTKNVLKRLNDFKNRRAPK